MNREPPGAERSSLENRLPATAREFESHTLRHFALEHNAPRRFSLFTAYQILSG